MQLALPASHGSPPPRLLPPPPQSRRRPASAGARIARPLYPGPTRVRGGGRAARLPAELCTDSATIGQSQSTLFLHTCGARGLRGAGAEGRGPRGAGPEVGGAQGGGGAPGGRRGPAGTRSTRALTGTLCSLAWQSPMPSRPSAWENDGGSRRPPPPSTSASPSASPCALTGDCGQEVPRVGPCGRRPRWHLWRVELLAGAQAWQQGPRPGGATGSWGPEPAAERGGAGGDGAWGSGGLRGVLNN